MTYNTWSVQELRRPVAVAFEMKMLAFPARFKSISCSSHLGTFPLQPGGRSSHDFQNFSF